MTKTIEIDDAQGQLRELVLMASAGHEVILSEHERPVARLVALPATVATRTPGLNRGEAWISPDFTDPLPDDVWDDAG